MELEKHVRVYFKLDYETTKYETSRYVARAGQTYPGSQSAISLSPVCAMFDDLGIQSTHLARVLGAGE